MCNWASDTGTNKKYLTYRSGDARRIGAMVSRKAFSVGEESIMSNSNRARGRRNRFHERLLRVRTGVHAFCWSEAVERIPVLPALSVLIFFLLYATTALGTKEVGGELGPVLSRLADEYDRYGAEGARKFIAVHELRARTSPDGQLVSVILEPLRKGDAASIDRGGVRGAGAVVDAVSRSYMRVLVPVERLRALSELPDISIVRAPIPAIPVDTGHGPIVAESVELAGAYDIQLAGFTGDGAKVAVVDLGFTGLDNAIAAGEIPAGAHRVKGNVEGVNIDGFTVHGVGVAEHVMDMAPGAELYCILVEDGVDLENAAEYIRDNGIAVANHPAGWDSAHGAGKLNLIFTFDSIPAILAITDVPGDQGLRVEVAWTGSGYDYAGSPRPVTAYDIFRRNGSNGWDSIATVPATGETGYATVALTEIDSTVSGGIAYTAFYVRGRTSAPVHYYESPPDSGYSVDNLVPPPPTGLAIGYNDPGGNFVLWDSSPEPDIDHYNVYRGESEDFVPDPGSLVHATADTFWVDLVPEGYRYNYKVTAVDDVGNEGEPAAPVIRTDAECCEIPLRYTLHQNFPNPFNPITTIKFDIRERARVRLVVYNVNGQRVRVLMDGDVPPGSREVVWNGRDDAGHSVASGIYFCRLESPGFIQSRKMILLK
jgi:hypothetical protein